MTMEVVYAKSTELMVPSHFSYDNYSTNNIRKAYR